MCEGPCIDFNGKSVHFCPKTSIFLSLVLAVVGGRCFAFLLVSGRFLFLRMVGGQCLNQYMVSGWWLMVGGLWSVVCGRWLVGGQWFCTTPSWNCLQHFSSFRFSSNSLNITPSKNILIQVIRVIIHFWRSLIFSV